MKLTNRLLKIASLVNENKRLADIGTDHGYILAHTPDMVIHNGTTQTTERVVNPDSKYLKVLKDHIRTYDEVIKYPPNQAYIGNITPQQLKEYDMPWYDKEIPNASKYGKFGEIMPQEEFIGLMQICDVFDLVKLEKNFASLTKKLLSENKLISSDLIEKIKDGETFYSGSFNFTKKDFADEDDDLFEEKSHTGVKVFFLIVGLLLLAGVIYLAITKYVL